MNKRMNALSSNSKFMKGTLKKQDNYCSPKAGKIGAHLCIFRSDSHAIHRSVTAHVSTSLVPRGQQRGVKTGRVLAVTMMQQTRAFRIGGYLGLYQPLGQGRPIHSHHCWLIHVHQLPLLLVDTNYIYGGKQSKLTLLIRRRFLVAPPIIDNWLGNAPVIASNQHLSRLIEQQVCLTRIKQQ